MADKRVNVSLNEQLYDTLEQLAERKNKSMATVLRDALALEQYVQDAKDRGARVQFVDRDGATRELVVR